MNTRYLIQNLAIIASVLIMYLITDSLWWLLLFLLWSVEESN